MSEYTLTEANVIHPGDTLILSTDQRLSQQAAADIKERALANLPEGVKVLVIGEGITVTIAQGEPA
jgi:hypothetical protein